MNEWAAIRRDRKRSSQLVLALAGLALMFLLQNLDWLKLICNCSNSPSVQFIVNKTVRVLVNDSFMLLFIHAWFFNRNITSLAWKLQLIDSIILLPAYLAFKLCIEGASEISSPLLSQWHRLIVNPTIMLLLIPAIYFQRLKEANNGR